MSLVFFFLGTTTTKDYLKAGILRKSDLLEAKVNPVRQIPTTVHIIMQYTNKYKLT